MSKESKIDLKKIMIKHSEYLQAQVQAKKHGKAVGKRLVIKYADTEPRPSGSIGGLQTDIASTAIAEMLYQCYKKSQEVGCQELLKKWIEEKFWGKIVEEQFPVLKEVWQMLHDRKYTKNNTCGYGDYDGSIWVEYPKEETRKVIIHKSHCSCADDNTHIFIMEEGTFGTSIHIRTVWPRQNSRGGYAVEKSAEHPNGWFSWGDDRDIKVPSLNTYRKRDFVYGYSDCRDEGYVLTIDGRNLESRAERAGSMQSEIQHALWLIGNMKSWIEEE